MLYVISWTVQPEARNAAQSRFKESGGAPPPDGVEMLDRWHSVEGNRGLCIARSDDSVALGKWIHQWSDLLVFDVFPVVNDDEFATILG